MATDEFLVKVSLAIFLPLLPFVQFVHLKPYLEKMRNYRNREEEDGFCICKVWCCGKIMSSGCKHPGLGSWLYRLKLVRPQEGHLIMFVHR